MAIMLCHGPRFDMKESVALSVGDWFFDRVGVSAIDCPYPCDNTCHNLVFKREMRNLKHIM
ncbi:hypothetical protein Scep_009521 [Stephania cephalantha]|uniref:Pectin acetylesterase n=1 Tax=Stephania cephalantha TaxID=152367 RepID=A0AAP0PGA5_9MAGN